MIKMTVKEALLDLRRSMDKIVSDYENIIFSQSKELGKQDETIKKLKDDTDKEDKQLANGE